MSNELPGAITELLRQPPARVVREKTGAVDIAVGGLVKDGSHLVVYERTATEEFAFLEVKPCAVQIDKPSPQVWAFYLLWPVPLNYSRNVVISKVQLVLPNWQRTDGSAVPPQELWASSFPQAIPAHTNFVLL